MSGYQSAVLACEDTLLQSSQTISMGTSEGISRANSLFAYVQSQVALFDCMIQY